MEIEVLAIEVKQQPIELYKLLKIANLVGGGGEAKMVIAEGYVFLNGQVEYQKRKKVYAEDIVQFNGEAIMPILSADNDAEANESIEPVNVNTERKAKPKRENVATKASKAAKSQHSKSTKKRRTQNEQKSQKPSLNERTGRKPISF
ncbi:RNA-binding S4 domain-containing protein [Thalassotalea ponticola]|uniref:RNA-binding S4 domain-containing protein n=1 Tax=Thalassotalea ponticola TaxID=1523392 RepID=UPI0025B32247|nr:RNA-binding S4 domain-containing protein [Thalassotalea ponticola]MDN3651628.1 RNA-binding S4 domain-containing protein [Thalassotalea ponticola]